MSEGETLILKCRSIKLVTILEQTSVSERRGSVIQRKQENRGVLGFRFLTSFPEVSQVVSSN